MLGHDRSGLNGVAGRESRSPRSTIPGASGPHLGRHLAALRAWRTLAPEAQRSAIWDGDDAFLPSEEPSRGRVRVGIWSPCLGLGGAESWQLALARSVDPDAVSWRGTAVIEGPGATHSRMAEELSAIMPVGHGLRAARSLAAACDVILSWAVTDVTALLVGLGAPPRVAVACHFPGESPWGPGTEAMLAGVDRLVAVSELALDSIPPDLRGRAVVIGNAVDAGRMEVRRDRATVRARWGVPGDAPVAGYLGRLAPEKDPGAMLRLAGGLPEPWHVVIVGEGRERRCLADRARALGLDRVRLVGGDTAAGDVLAGFDALVVPSHYESFGLTLAEGLWAGVPVVATRSGLAKLRPGLVRTVAVGASGRDLAAAVLADRADSEGTRSRVERARAFARDRLGLARFGREWTDCLVGLGRRRGGIPGEPSPSEIREPIGGAPCLATTAAA